LEGGSSSDLTPPGFEVLPKRWIIERTSAMIRIILRRLAAAI
jgi:hypothetical protein